MSKNRSKKKTLVVIKNGNDKLFLNPSDLKTVEVFSNSNGNTVTIQTSVFKHSFGATNYLVNDKFRPALRERYDIITIDERSGISSNAQSYAPKPNSIVVVKQGERTTYIFPKGLKAVEADGNKITVHAFRRSLTVDLGRAVNPTEIELIRGARLERGPEVLAVEES